MASLFKQMSSQSRYLRYHHAKLRLTRVTPIPHRVDYFDHFALIAFTVGESGPSAVGVARYIDSLQPLIMPSWCWRSSTAIKGEGWARAW